jgi:hypothetical protein
MALQAPPMKLLPARQLHWLQTYLLVSKLIGADCAYVFAMKLLRDYKIVIITCVGDNRRDDPRQMRDWNWAVLFESLELFIPHTSKPCNHLGMSANPSAQPALSVSFMEVAAWAARRFLVFCAA